MVINNYIGTVGPFPEEHWSQGIGIEAHVCLKQPPSLPYLRIVCVQYYNYLATLCMCAFWQRTLAVFCFNINIIKKLRRIWPVGGYSIIISIIRLWFSYSQQIKTVWYLILAPTIMWSIASNSSLDILPSLSRSYMENATEAKQYELFQISHLKQLLINKHWIKALIVIYCELHLPLRLHGTYKN